MPWRLDEENGIAIGHGGWDIDSTHSADEVVGVPSWFGCA